MIGSPADRVLQPESAESAAAMLAEASREHVPLLIRGGGTKRQWGRRSTATTILCTAQLNAPVMHQAGDLVATVPAGATLDEVNRILATQGQWIPLDPLGPPGATIGGIVAAHDSGPRRHRYGTPRDLIIGVEIALTDGRRVKAGGRVVKNVAGYDLARLMCGSFGALALVTTATFKLSPLPAASRTLVASVGSSASAGESLDRLGRVIADLAVAPLTPSAFEVQWPTPRLLVRFESTRAAAERQASAAAERCRRLGVETDVLADAAEADAWHAHAVWMGAHQATIARIVVLPAQVGAMLSSLERSGRDGVTVQVIGRAALGVLNVRLDGALTSVASTLLRLRSDAVAAGGNLALLAAPAELASSVDPWGNVGDGVAVMRAVKARFDPSGVLNPGGGPGGLS